MNNGFAKLNLVSVVIPSNNSEKTIETCLTSIKAQTYENIEIIIADNYSTDKTREIAKNFGARVVLCKGGRSRARNFGASLSKGVFILSIDSDMELAPNVVGECVAKVESGFDAVIIPEHSVGEGFWAKCKTLEKQCYVGDDLIEAARFFRRSVFEAVGGYNLELEFGEDWDINQRIVKGQFRTGRIGALIKHNEGKLRLRETMFKKRNYGKTLDLYRLKHPEEAKKQLTLIRLAFVRSWRKLLKDPIHALGMFLMKACELVAVGLGK